MTRVSKKSCKSAKEKNLMIDPVHLHVILSDFVCLCVFLYYFKL